MTNTEKNSIDENKLKNLYTYLIANRKAELAGWYDAYKNFYDKVKDTREKLTPNGCLSSSDEDKKFLKQLIFDGDNGIASAGSARLTEDSFNSAIEDDKFIEIISSIIKAESADKNKKNYNDLKAIWKKKKNNEGFFSRQNHLRINRIFSATTRDVSTAADEPKFNIVFQWLQNEKIVPKYEGERNWYTQNLWLMAGIHNVFKAEIENEETDKFWLSIFIWQLYENIANPFTLKKQIVKYGAPGTGKTFKAKQQTRLQFDIWKAEFAENNNDFTHEGQIETVQFHPSYSYEDFIEGLRPILKDGKAELSLQNGIFKAFCQKAARWEIDYFRLANKPKYDDGKDKSFDELTISDLNQEGIKETLKPKIHWEYLLNNENKNKKVVDAIPPHFFIIDEINRAELSRVFGELMYCLEYRGIEGAIKTQYANLNSNETAMLTVNDAHQFFIPHNVYLIGTMNTIDRSIESFDFALRRRFRWEEVSPNTNVLRYHLVNYNKNWENLAESLGKLNEAIEKEPLLGKDYQIGHAYLMNLKYPKTLTVKQVSKSIWEDSLYPLLQEYLRGTGKEETTLNNLGRAFGI